MKMISTALISATFLASIAASPVSAVEFKVECTSFDDCMSKGDMLAKKHKLSLSREAYRNAIKLDMKNDDAWRKFEKIVVRISEEGGC